MDNTQMLELLSLDYTARLQMDYINVRYDYACFLKITQAIENYSEY